MAVIAIGSLAIAATERGDASRFLSLAVAVFCLVLVVMGAITAPWHRPRTVNLSARPGTVTFRGPDAALQMSLVLAAFVSIAVLGAWSLDGAEDLGFYGRSAAAVLPLVGVAMLASTVWSWRRAAGLSVSPERVWGVRAGPKVDLLWDELGEVSVREVKNRRLLVLTTRGSEVLRVPEAAVSGDAYAVGTVVRYYLEHPGERWRLAEGLDAVMHVDREVRGERFEAL